MNTIWLFSSIRPEASRERICTKFGTAVGVADVITRDKVLVR